MTDAVAGSRIVLLSDLHAGAPLLPTTGTCDRFTDDDAFAELTGSLAADRSAGSSTLVLLGDFVELLPARLLPGAATDPASAALRLLDLVAAAHPVVFEGLRGLTAAGWRLVVVAGNHDADLLRPAVARELAAMLGPGSSVEPWLLHEPGLLWAEHGHRYHALNAFRRRQLGGGAGRLDTPIGAALALWPAAGCYAARPGVARRRLLLDAVADSLLPLRGAATEPYAGPRAVAGQTARRLAEGLGRADGQWSPVDAAAPVTLRALALAGTPARFVVFGHTHRATVTELGGGAYLNCGTWSCVPRGSASRRTFVEVLAEPAGTATARLLRWEQGRPQPLGTAVSAGASPSPRARSAAATLAR